MLAARVRGLDWRLEHEFIRSSIFSKLYLFVALPGWGIPDCLPDTSVVEIAFILSRCVRACCEACVGLQVFTIFTIFRTGLVSDY